MRAVYAFLLLISVHSQAAQFFTGPISSAMGGTGAAGIGSAEGSFLNPATLPLIKSYEAIAYYRDGYIDDGSHRQGWMVGAVDNSEGVLFPGALHYGKIRDTGRGAGSAVEGEIWHISIAYLISQRLSLGLTGYRLLYDIDGQSDTIQWNGGLGMIVLVNEDVALSYTLNNIAKPSSDVPMGLREDMEQGIGSFWRLHSMATLRFDVARLERNNPGQKMVLKGGMESAINEYWVFRFGYRSDERVDLKVASAGFGFNGPRLRMDYSIEKNVERTSGALHSVDLRIPF